MKLKNIIITGTACLMAVTALTACLDSGLRERETVASSAPNIERSDLVGGSSGVSSDMVPVTDEKIERFIAEYNRASGKPFYDYTLYLSDKGVYYALSDGQGLCIRTDLNGDVICATPYGISGDDAQVTVGSAVMEVLWGREYVPGSAKREMAAILQNHKNVTAEVQKKVDEWARAPLDTTMPDYTLPSMETLETAPETESLTAEPLF